MEAGKDRRCPELAARNLFLRAWTFTLASIFAHPRFFPMTDHSLVQISSEQMSAEIHPLGAQLFSLRDKRGRDLQWNGDPAIWKGRAPILFPVVGALAGNQYRLDGKVFSRPRHGFARDRVFSLAAKDAGSALFRLDWSEETFSRYPFRFQLDLQFSVSDATLRMAAAIRNLEENKVLPASFGFHPAFRWPLPYGEAREDHVLTFEEDEPAPIRRLDRNGLLLPTDFETPVKSRRLPLRDELFAADAIIFDSIASRRLGYGAERGPWLEIQYDGMPYLGVWTKPGAGYVCIEPWSGLADPQGYSGDFYAKPGLNQLGPRTSKTFAMSVSLVT
jgi:galactose mutarotase-like enzyme